MLVPAPATCNAWPDASRGSLERLLALWGWRVAGARRFGSWGALFGAAADAARRHEADDEGRTWGLGHWAAAGWQVLYEARAHPGGLREIYEELPFPVLEWVLFPPPPPGGDDGDRDFDLDVLAGQSFFPASVRGGALVLAPPAPPAPAGGALHSVRLPGRPGGLEPALEPALHVYPSLAETLRRLGVPGALWPEPGGAAMPTFLDLESLS